MNVVPMTPITSVKILKNVPLDSTYKDTLDFSSVSAQTSYFTGKTKYTFTNLTPIRLQNTIRVPVVADNLYDCNYIAFQNANFYNKWFYAFITGIRFVNINMSEIEFELDVMQTWWFDFTVKPSFVEREHVNNDAIGANLVEENLEIGEYIFTNHVKAGVSNSSIVVVASTVDETGAAVDGGYYGGVYSGVKFFKFTAAQANDFIKKLTDANKSSAIVSIFMGSNDFLAEQGRPPATKEISIAKVTGSINDYIPKNNKLFTYPYNFLYCINTNGNTANFRYEFFDTPDCTFGLIGETSCNPQVTLLPYSYKLSGQGNLNEKMVLNGFPQCAYNIDSFKAWLAQNGSTTALSVLGSSAALVTGAVVSGGIGAVAAIAGITGIFSTMAQVRAQSAKPPQANGASGSGNTFAYGQLDFHFYTAQITAQYAQQIDDYFSMFGYAVHRVKVPNITGRPSWNYVKTIDVKIVGSVPFDDMNRIRSIFDNGVTFWHGDWVGDYTRANK